MKTIIKLVIAIAILTAAFQGSRALMSNYQFEDDIQQAMQFSPNASDDEMIEKIVGLASDYGLPVQAGNVTMSERASDRIANVTYTTDVAFIPGLITRPITFNPSASVRLLRAPRR